MVSVYGFLEMDSLWQALCPFTWYEEKPGFGLHHVKLQTVWVHVPFTKKCWTRFLNRFPFPLVTFERGSAAWGWGWRLSSGSLHEDCIFQILWPQLYSWFLLVCNLWLISVSVTWASACEGLRSHCKHPDKHSFLLSVRFPKHESPFRKSWHAYYRSRV